MKQIKKNNITNRYLMKRLAFLTVICMLFLKCGTGLCSSNSSIKTFIGFGSRAVVNGNPAAARDKAIQDAISSSVANAVTAILTKSDIISHLDFIYNQVLDNPQQYIVTYSVLNGLEKKNRYIVVVESKVDSSSLNTFFTKQGILNKKNEKPNVLLLISEQRPGEILPRYWWGKNPLPYKSITEKTIADYLMGNNICKIVEINGKLLNSEQHGIIFKSIHDSDAAIKLGLKLKADIIVIGSANAKETLNTMGNEKSYQANVCLKVFKTDTGDQIASVDTKAVVKDTISQNGIENGFKQAGLDAGKKLADDITQSFTDQNKGPRTIEITIKGTDYLSSFIMLKRIMNKMDGIQDIQTKELGSDQAVADITFLGSAKELADALLLQTFDSFGIEISDVKDNSLTIKFVPVNSTKPVSKSDIEAAHISE